MTCPENAEALIEQVVHPLDKRPEVYNYDCDRRGLHRVHHAKTWNEGIHVEWDDNEFTIVMVML